MQLCYQYLGRLLPMHLVTGQAASTSPIGATEHDIIDQRKTKAFIGLLAFVCSKDCNNATNSKAVGYGVAYS